MCRNGSKNKQILMAIIISTIILALLIPINLHSQYSYLPSVNNSPINPLYGQNIYTPYNSSLYNPGLFPLQYNPFNINTTNQSNLSGSSYNQYIQGPNYYPYNQTTNQYPYFNNYSGYAPPSYNSNPYTANPPSLSPYGSPYPQNPYNTNTYSPPPYEPNPYSYNNSSFTQSPFTPPPSNQIPYNTNPFTPPPPPPSPPPPQQQQQQLIHLLHPIHINNLSLFFLQMFQLMKTLPVKELILPRARPLE